MATKIVLRAEAPPLRQDPNGCLRVGSSCVLLELVIGSFFDGATPETIAESYPTASLADIYGVIAYYLRHREEIEVYLEEREQRAVEVREKIERSQGDLAHLRSRLRAFRSLRNPRQAL